MKKPRLKKPEATHIRGICVVCNKNPQRSSGKNDGKFKPVCRPCCNKRTPATRLNYQKHNRPHTLHKKDKCERCGFDPEHPCQLDVDHIDGDHSNNDELNLMTLCANCHRLKTLLNKDWEDKTSTESSG